MAGPVVPAAAAANLKHQDSSFTITSKEQLQVVQVVLLPAEVHPQLQLVLPQAQATVLTTAWAAPVWHPADAGSSASDCGGGR